MTTFVKICPKCGHHNPEYENACSVCTYFIGMETPVPAPAPLDDSALSVPPTNDESPKAGVATLEPSSRPATSETASPSPSLYLHVLSSGLILEIHDGATLGQAHPSSNADLQLRDLAGIDYVHRNHCQFSSRDGTWHITPIDQRQFGRDFTNPTVVNQAKVAPGQSQALRNGDQLNLANVKFVVRII